MGLTKQEEKPFSKTLCFQGSTRLYMRFNLHGPTGVDPVQGRYPRDEEFACVVTGQESDTTPL
jgi:hypothetical protein